MDEVENTQETDEQVKDEVLDTPATDEQVDDSLEQLQEILNEDEQAEGLLREQAEGEPEGEPKSTHENDLKNEILIDDSLVEQFSSLNPLKGKPISELGKSYEEAVKELNKAKQELSQLKETDKKIDPLDDPDGFTEQVLSKAKLAAKEEYVQQQKEEIEYKKAEKEYLESFQKALPEGITVENAVEFFKTKNELGEKDIQFYTTNPDMFIKNVSMAVENELLRNQIDKKAKSKAYDLLNENMRKANKSINKGTQSKVIKSGELSEVDQLANDIFNMSYDENDWK